jgi:hypothetical protein
MMMLEGKVAPNIFFYGFTHAPGISECGHTKKALLHEDWFFFSREGIAFLLIFQWISMVAPLAAH